MTSHWKQVIAGVFFPIALMTLVAAAQDAANGIDPATLAKAKAGDANAELLVGVEYQKGDIVPRDFVQAAEWFRKAAEQGNAPAQYRLGLLYQQRESGITEDDTQAAAWLHKAADQGNAEAEAALALCYSHGKGVSHDDAQAVAWNQKAVAQNNTAAMVNLALLYSHGQGVSKDEKQAFALVDKAAELGSAEAEYQLGVDYEQGQGVKKDKNQAISWYHKSADQGNPWAQYNLGAMLSSNHAEAYFWLSLAADKLEGDALLRANIERDAAAVKLKPAEKAETDQRIRAWHPTPATHP